MVDISPLYVVDENSRRTIIIELTDMLQLLDEGEAAEDELVADRRLAPILGLIHRLAVECPSR
jgi:hypothetical protein